MFDVLPNVIASCLTTLFPIFASYKALRAADPAQLTPWLMYWVVFSICSLFEFWTSWLLVWMPFYAWIRLGVLSYLVLPQTQGARMVYEVYIERTLVKHEAELDRLVDRTYHEISGSGSTYVRRFVVFIRHNLLGISSIHAANISASTASPDPSREGLQQSKDEGDSSNGNGNRLLSRFMMPSVYKDSLLAQMNGQGLYAQLHAALARLSSTTSSTLPEEDRADELSRSGLLIPEDITTVSGKMGFLSSQRQQLRILLSALDKEASNLNDKTLLDQKSQTQVDVSSKSKVDLPQDVLKKSKSEASFEEIAGAPVIEETRHDSDTRSSGWVAWIWSRKA